MKPASLIVWERTGQWASRLRRTPQCPQPALREVHSGEELLWRLEQSPASLAAIEFQPSHAGRIAERLWDIERRFPRARSVVLSDRAWESFAPMLIEAGARAFVTTERQLEALVRLVNRHLELASAAALRADPSSKGNAGATTAEGVAAVLDELFDGLAEPADGRSIDRAIAELSSLVSATPILPPKGRSDAGADARGREPHA